MDSSANTDVAGNLDCMPLFKRRRLLRSRHPSIKQVPVEVLQEWPAFPRGVKFDPSDEDLLWHLLAKVGKGEAVPHPLISEFIISVDEDDGFAYSYPHKLPGVKEDGSVYYFFHRTKAYDTRGEEHHKRHNNDFGTVCWRKIGSTKPLYVEGIHQGCKKVMVLYMTMTKGEKPEKSNWVMHRYRVGRKEDEGEFVLSKLFYQLKSRQYDIDIHDSPRGTVEVVYTEPVTVVDPKSVRPKHQSEIRHIDLILEEASTQAKYHETTAEKNIFHAGWQKSENNGNNPAEDPNWSKIQPQNLLDSQQHENRTLACDGLLQRQSSSEAAFDYSQMVDDNLKNDLEECRTGLFIGDCDRKDLQSEKDYCNMVTKGEATHTLLDSNYLHLISSSEIIGHTAGQSEVDFNTHNLLRSSTMLNYATHGKVEHTAMQTSSCSEVADNTSHSYSDLEVSTQLSEFRSDDLDHISLQERRKMLLANIDCGFGDSGGSKSCQDNRLCALKPCLLNSIQADDNEVISKGGSHGTFMSQTICGSYIIGLQAVSLRLSDNLMKNTNECITGRVKDEIHPDGPQFPLEDCHYTSVGNGGAKYMDNFSFESPNNVTGGSSVTVDKSLPSPLNCLNTVLLESSHSQESQVRDNMVSYQTSAPEVKLPTGGVVHGHVNAQSQLRGSACSNFVVDLKAKPLEENHVDNISEADVGRQYSTKILGFPYMGNISRKFQENLESNHKCSNEACISEANQCSIGQGLANQNGSNELCNSAVLSGFPLQVKTEPDTRCLSEEKAKNCPSSSLSGHPTERHCTVIPCLSKSNPQDNHFSDSMNSGQTISTSCICYNPTYLPEDVNHSSIDATLLSTTKCGSLDSLNSETHDPENQCPVKDDHLQDNILSSGSNLQEEMGVRFDPASLPGISSETNNKLPNLISSHPIKREFFGNGFPEPCQSPPSNLPKVDMLRPDVKREPFDELAADVIDHISFGERVQMPVSQNFTNLKCEINTEFPQQTFLPTPDRVSVKSVDAKGSRFSFKRKRKKTATDSVETALEEDAPGLLKDLLDRGITPEEIKLYGDMEDDEALGISSSEDGFEELEAVISKLFSDSSSIFKFPSVRQIKGSKAVYCLSCLISLIEQTRYLRFRQSPVEWGWCRDLQSFLFVFERHNRIVLERPEYGYATYFFELVESLPIEWQIKRLVTAMKLPSCSRTTLIENKPLLVGEDVTEGEARVLEEYGWARNGGLGTMLNYCDRVVHDRKNEQYSTEWRAKIGKLLMCGHDRGRHVLKTLPKKVEIYLAHENPEIKMEL